MPKGWVEQASFWTDDPTAQTFHYVDAHGYTWVVKVVSGPKSVLDAATAWWQWHARPAEPDGIAFYGPIRADYWPVSAATEASAGSMVTRNILADAIDEWITQFEAKKPKPSRFPWWLLALVAWAASRKGRS